ncbi:MAG: phosphatase PAP2 family protein [Methylococcaceae bacterium]|nr:phosphatase PAP2 family protein [Prolixibacteraceae bacterium]
MEFLQSLDRGLFLLINGWHSSFFDPIMFWLSDRLIWIPMYLLIAFLLIRQYKMRGVLMLVFVGTVIMLCDQTASGVLKETVHRLRPSHDPSLVGMIRLSKAGPGGMYGFASSHAANVFGLTTLLYFVLDQRFKILKYWLFIWAVLVSYSRIYNGVHYPGDVIVGAIIGAAYGYLLAKAYFKLDEYLLKRKAASSKAKP